MYLALASLIFSVHQHVWASEGESLESASYVLAELKVLEKLSIPVLSQDLELGLGVGQATDSQKQGLSEWSHSRGKCGGFELLSEKILGWPEARKGGPHVSELAKAERVFLPLRKQREKEKNYLSTYLKKNLIVFRPEISSLIEKAKKEELEAHVKWLQSYPNRFHRADDPNKHVSDLEKKVQSLLLGSSLSGEVRQVAHSSTKQRSLKLSLAGKSRPQEIVVLGGHLDSVNQGFFISKRAPGADDNASGSSNLIEALRVFLDQGKQPERTVEFFWYAGEEAGLLGSGEIAESYAQDSKDVVAVLQLDMTLHPGAGVFTLGNVTDYTSAWLRQFFVEANNLYLKANLIEDQCGYACSDHASWFRRGYSTLLPFEADTSTMNPLIHTERDLINGSSNFEHSLVFTKLAIIFAEELGNSDLRGESQR